MSGDVIRLPVQEPPSTPIEPIEITYHIGGGLENVWQDFYPFIAQACDETLRSRDIFELVSEGKALLWIVRDPSGVIAIASTRRIEKHGNTWLDVMTIGGKDWKRWAPTLNEQFIHYAKGNECDAITAHVRRGLKRWLEALGWRERQIHMEYRLDG